jgi:hypothetical protein
MGEKTKSLSKIIILSVVFSLLLFTKVNAAILFEDDFNDGVADGWNEFSGTWSVINFEYVETNQSVGGETFTGHPNWTSYIYEARIKRGDGDEDNDFGLIFYAQSTEDYLRFTIWSDYEPPTPRITHIRPEPNPWQLLCISQILLLINGMMLNLFFMETQFLLMSMVYLLRTQIIFHLTMVI